MNFGDFIELVLFKAYTDINQSRQLAEILPIEGADMAWCNYSIKGVNYTDKYSVNPYTVKEMRECFDKSLNGWDKYWKLIPCWSLAALLNVLPFPQISKNKLGNGKVGWMVSVYPNDCRYDSCWHDNPIDACYEVVLKLHEQNIL